MSTIGSNPLREHYMSLKALGALIIETTPTAENPDVFRVDIGCENRLSAISATTQKDETVDQFCQRVRGILRAMMNEPVREQKLEEKLVEEKKPIPSWDEQKLKMKGTKHEQPQPATAK